MLRPLIACGLAVALGACAAVGLGRRAPPTPASRGHAVAVRACAACHAVEPGGTSRSAKAPAFGSLEMRHTAPLDNRVAELTRVGHYAMPPISLSSEEVRDLVAYIESLPAR